MGRMPLYTIGHGRREIGEFIQLLHQNAIEYLVDVRSVPFSRFNPQYNQKALSASLEKAGIRYVFMGDLLGGRPKDESCYVDGKIDYSILSQKPFFQKGIERLKKAYMNENRLAIMCSESDPRHCHRSKLIGNVLIIEKIPFIHIDEKGDLKEGDTL
jgi:uncharacterized protein (DUF488 family)